MRKYIYNVECKVFYFSVLFLLFQVSLFAQENLFGGIEIGSMGIKMTVVDVDTAKSGEYTIKLFWTENIGIAKGIAVDGNLSLNDINKASNVVKSNLDKFLSELKIPQKNIFIVASSGVGMAKNTQVLIDKIKETTNMKLDFIDVATEGKLLLKKGIPKSDYNSSFVLDIGAGNTKGGYIDSTTSSEFNFFPLTFNYGTITLTEEINKKNKKKDLTGFIETLFGQLPNLREQIKGMYNSSPLALQKENIYLSGGAVWAFYTLYNGKEAQGVFNEFKLQDVIHFDAKIKNDYKYFQELAKTNKEVEKVLNTYSQKHLISASYLLMFSLESIPNINDKKLYFAKQNQGAWLISYIK
jgi:exopolyphosphatase/pppGpp-phosphohydrolase